MSDLAQIEALLFVAGEEGMTLLNLAQVTKSTTSHVSDCLLQLKSIYNSDEDRGITLIETANCYKLVSKSEFNESIREYAQSPLMQKLSRSLLETLSIIAYKQPITRMEIEEIRGVSATNALQKLKLRDLIKDVDRLDAPGNPVLYGTTDYFLDYFALNSLEELPDVDSTVIHQETQLFDPNRIDETINNDETIRNEEEEA